MTRHDFESQATYVRIHYVSIKINDQVHTHYHDKRTHKVRTYVHYVLCLHIYVLMKFTCVRTCVWCVCVCVCVCVHTYVRMYCMHARMAQLKILGCLRVVLYEIGTSHIRNYCMQIPIMLLYPIV